MPRVKIKIKGKLLDELSEAFFWEEQRSALQDGLSEGLFEERSAFIVARVHALSIEIRLHEKHGPPHFHVTYQGEEASFSILDCRRLRGKMGLKRFDAKIRLMVEQESNALDQKMECLSSDRLSRWSNKFVAFLAVRQ
jgi:hypothetical protein